VEHSWRNVYAGELEVRPPGAPTTNSHPTEKAPLNGSRQDSFGGQRINLREFLGNFKIERI
jgi:hypothetical protein